MILFVHGFVEHIGRYESAFPLFTSHNVGVFAYDQRGFGRTALDKEKKSKDAAYGKTSWKEQVQDVEWWVGYLGREWKGVPIFLMGHSMVNFGMWFLYPH